MQELLRSDEFRAFRKAQIQTIVEHIAPFLFMPEAYQAGELKGALDLARKLIQLPTKLAKGTESADLIKLMITEDIRDFQARFIKKHITTD